MLWWLMTLVFTCVANVVFLGRRRSRYRALAVVGLVIAVLALIGGMSIGYAIAPSAALISAVALAMHLWDGGRDIR